MRILIVDDDTFCCSVAKKKLASLPADVTETFDGVSAWNLARAETFDLALVDLGLPGLDGLALIEHLRQYPKTRKMPIIVITGRDDRESIESAFEAGATLFLTKPINWTLIGHQIKCVMRMIASEREAHQAHQRLRAENRIKDTVIGRLNYGLRPLAWELSGLARKIVHLANSSGGAEAIKSCATRMMNDAVRLDTGLAKMTAFAVAISTELDISEGQTPLHTAVEGITQMVHRSAAARDVRFRTELPASEIQITCDPAQLSRAIFNIVDNAIRFAPAGSIVNLAARPLDDGSLYFSVDDEGCGISPNLLVQLLSPQVEVPEGQRFEAQLTGTGLAAAKHIMEAHGGALEIRSAVGRGTTAILHLPADRIGRPTPAVRLPQIENSAA